MKTRYPRIASFKTVDAFRGHLDTLGLSLPCDDKIDTDGSPLATALPLGEMRGRKTASPNRFAIHPMEGWDANDDGTPSDLTRHRWRNFGLSGAGLIWGGEAVAVRADGRANPNQLLMTEANAGAIGALRSKLLESASEHGLPTPVVGLQLTHSGRWARSSAEGKASGPKGCSAPRTAYRHPILDRRLGIDTDEPVLRDEEIEELIRDFARAAHLANEEGFDFVDIKHCHGYLWHEFLSARTREGRYGGPTLADRSRITMELLDAVRDAAPDLGIGVRLSVFDRLPHRPDGVDDQGHLGPGVPESADLPYPFGFGLCEDDPTRSDLTEPAAFVEKLVGRGVRMINVTAGSPYYVPHVQRPAAFPPSDGYAPPEDPVAGVVRLLEAARDLKALVPEAIVVSTGWTYLQEFLPHVAQACVRNGWFDAVGLGRMVLSYPDLPADVLAGRGLTRKRVCRTFSDCTTAPRNGMVSGCYPLDPLYRQRDERDRVEAIKKEL